MKEIELSNTKPIGDFKMANETGKGVRYTFEGQYYTGNKDQSEQVKEYSLQVIFPKVFPNALSIFKTSLIKQCDGIYKLMKNKYPDFKTIRTYTVAGVEDLNGNEVNTHNIAFMSVSQLTQYVAEKDLEIDAKIYADDVTKFRNAIILAETDPEKFKEVYNADIQEYEFNKQIKELNNVPETVGDGVGQDETDDIADLLGKAEGFGE